MTTPINTPPPFPPFDPAASYSATGRDALFYVLAYGDGATFQLDDLTLAAAADYVNTAQTARDISAPALSRLTATQSALRGILRYRATLREATAQAFAAMFPDSVLAAADAPAVAPVDVPAPVVDVPAPVAVAPTPAAPVAPVAPAAVPDGWRAMAARFASRCGGCGGYVAAGDPILYRKGSPARHSSCPPSSNGGGGSKVPLSPLPIGGAPSAALAAPVAAPVARVPAPVLAAAPAPYGVPPLSPTDDLF